MSTAAVRVAKNAALQGLWLKANSECDTILNSFAILKRTKDAAKGEVVKKHIGERLNALSQALDLLGDSELKTEGRFWTGIMDPRNLSSPALLPASMEGFLVFVQMIRDRSDTHQDLFE